MELVTRRKLVNGLALAASLAAMAFGVFWLAWILFDVLRLGLGGLSWDLFTKMTPPPGGDGGLANAIAGSCLMVGLAMLIGTPVGVLAGIYLAEYGQRGWLAGTTRFINDILLSAPSIVIGLFVYAILVARFGGFSGWAGVVALALIVVPVVVRTTENMLILVPNSLREAAFALGAPKWRVVSGVTLRAASAGVVTGILLAVARIAGETAPLLFTALGSQYLSFDVDQPMAALPLTVFTYATGPYEEWHRNAWAAALVLILVVLVLSVGARLAIRRRFTLDG